MTGEPLALSALKVSFDKPGHGVNNQGLEQYKLLQ
jgi:hypothetical protein